MITGRLFIPGQILLIVLFACFVFPAPRLFRKYKIVHVAIEVIRSRPELIHKLWIRKYNRTTPVMDGDLAILDSKLSTFKIWIEGFERLGMEHIYTKSAISVSGTYCDFLAGKFLLNGGLQDVSDFPTTCPLKKGNYTVRNWVVEDKYLPPYFPGNHWRIDVYMGPPNVKVHSNQTSKISYYFQVIHF